CHGAIHPMPSRFLLADSYHVSRYNTSTRRLTQEMFETAVGALLDRLGVASTPLHHGYPLFSPPL
ncbi:MAG: hypothetical protein ACREF1_06340, partial [Acetobacteraceae bacterium]